MSSVINIILRAVDNASKPIAQAALNITGSMDKAAGSLNSVSDAVSIASGVMIRDLAQDAFSAVTKAADTASQSFMDYEQTITKIIGATSAVGEEATQLTAELTALAQSQTHLGYSGADASKGLESLVKAGMPVAEVGNAITASLSLARLEEIGTDEAAGLLVQTLTMFNMTASQSSEALNAISKAADAGIGNAKQYASGLANCGAAAANMGMEINESLAALVIMDKKFGSPVEGGTYLNAMFKDLIAKNEELGVSLYNSDGSMRDLADIVDQLKGKMAAFGNDQEAVNNYLSVLDVRAQKAVIGLVNYDGSIQQVMKDMDAARSVQEKVGMTMDTTAGKMAQLKAEQENVSYQLGEMTAQLQLNWQQFALSLGPIGAVVDALGPSMLQGAMTGVMMAAPKVITGVLSMVAAYGVADTATMLLATATGVLGAALEFLKNNPIVLVITGIAAALMLAYTACPPFRDAINKIAEVLGGALGKAAQAVSDVLGWLWNNVVVPLGDAFMQLWDIITNNPILSLLGGPLTTIVYMMNHWEDVVKAVQNAWGGFCDFVGGLYSKTLKPVFDGINWAYEHVLKPVGDFLGGIGGAISDVGKAISNVAQGKPIQQGTTVEAKSKQNISKIVSTKIIEEGLGQNGPEHMANVIASETKAAGGSYSEALATANLVAKAYKWNSSETAAFKKMIPKLADGGAFNPYTPTLAVIGEGKHREIAAPEPVLREVFRQEFVTVAPKLNSQPYPNIIINNDNRVSVERISTEEDRQWLITLLEERESRSNEATVDSIRKALR